VAALAKALGALCSAVKDRHPKRAHRGSGSGAGLVEAVDLASPTLAITIVSVLVSFALVQGCSEQVLITATERPRLVPNCYEKARGRPRKRVR
jgi:hypothetical protein